MEDSSWWTWCLGFSSKVSQFHVIFQKTPVNYYITIKDVKIHVKLTRYNTDLDHDKYLSYIQAYASHGWGLAGIIQMGDESYREVYDDYESESEVDPWVWPSIKLIYQSPAKKGSPGGLL